MSDNVIQIEGVTGGYGDLIVVRDISFNVRAGETISITGRNGVGKTTFIKILSGSLPLSGGKIEFRGVNLSNMAEHKRFNLGISYAPQERIVFDDLSVEDNLTLHYQETDLDRYEDFFDKFPRLKERLKQRAGTLSGGEKKLLSFTRAVAEPTELVLLDEPTEGVQFDNINHMSQIISNECSKGRAFIVVDQNLSFLESITDAVHLIDHGEQIYYTDEKDFRPEIESRISI